MTQQRVLVVVDPTATSHPAIERAAWFARAAKASIELFISDYAPHLAEPRSYGAAAEARAALLERHRRHLELLAQPLLAAGVAVATDVRFDYPLHDSIVRKTIDGSADFVVKDTHYHSALKRSIFSNTDWNLIRSCPAALWLVKPRPPGRRPLFVAAVDPLHEHDKPADLDHRIVEKAALLSEALGGHTHVFHAFDVMTAIAISTGAMTMPITLPINDLADAMRAEHTEAVERLCKQHRVPPERMHIQQGGTRQALLALTEQLRADAVVMGAVSRSGLKGLFIGNTAEDLLDRLQCDVVIVKPRGFQPPPA